MRNEKGERRKEKFWSSESRENEFSMPSHDKIHNEVVKLKVES